MGCLDKDGHAVGEHIVDQFVAFNIQTFAGKPEFW